MEDKEEKRDTYGINSINKDNHFKDARLKIGSFFVQRGSLLPEGAGLRGEADK